MGSSWHEEGCDEAWTDLDVVRYGRSEVMVEGMKVI